MATIQYVSFPLLSLGSSNARLNPKLSISPIARIIDLVGLTKPKIQKRNTRLQVIMHIRDQKTQITFRDKNIDLIIHSKSIGSQQTHRKKSYIK